MTRGPGISRPATPAAPAARPISEDAGLASALARLNAEGRSRGDESAIWTAISTETKVPVDALRQQRAATSLNYGELIVANSLAARSGNNFNKIIALRATAGSWSQLARNLKIDPASLTARVSAANASLQKGKTRKS
ncbi:MAG: hypothetical protein ABIR71_04340 [Chthoniobacterales bacterium]